MKLLSRCLRSSLNVDIAAILRICCWVGVMMGLSGTPAEAGSQRIYIGTYTRGTDSSGIYTCEFDDQTGRLSEPRLAVETDNPSFLAIHPQRPLLVCCNEVDDYDGRPQGAVSLFRIDVETGALQFINQQPTGGAAPCHLAIDATGRFVLTTNYTGGSTTVLPIDDNDTLLPQCCFIQHEGSGPNQQRQEMAHAHSVNLSSDNQFAYVADLGTDRIWIFRFDEDTGTLTPAAPDAVSVAAGGGPRHFAFGINERFAWSNNELTSSVTGFRRDPQTGQLEVVEELPTLPNDFDGHNSTAECRRHPNGRFLYVSNRGHDSIAAFAIANDGRLTLLDITSSGGQEPRNFHIVPDGRWLLSENQNSDSVVVFQIADDGTLQRTAHEISVGSPVCIRMLSSDDDSSKTRDN